ncbi:class I SAM-dependent methyltransferase [Salisediminibacterium beveridgei]|nr:class I SAM-dependent methyltransferase [Salisediminibacterium beveridgei]
MITTARKSGNVSPTAAIKLAQDWQMDYIPREGQSIRNLLTKLRDQHGSDLRLFIVGDKRIELYSNENREPFFFHPNAAMFRAKHFVRYGTDPLLTAAGIKPGDSIVDATLGLGADAQLLSMATGKNGIVKGLEASVDIARITGMGLSAYQHGFSPLIEAMRRVEVEICHHTEWLEKQPSDAYDVIYFDPMFDEKLTQSYGISGLRNFSFDEVFTKKAVEEAVRVARKRVVLKDHFRSNRFESYGFTRMRRKSSTIHYGLIETDRRQV